MKSGIRTPNLKKSLKAKTTGRMKRQIKKSVNPLYGKKGMGYVNNPKKAIYNKVYNKTTVDIVPKGKSKTNTNKTSDETTHITDTTKATKNEYSISKTQTYNFKDEYTEFKKKYTYSDFKKFRNTYLKRAPIYFAIFIFLLFFSALNDIPMLFIVGVFCLIYSLICIFNGIKYAIKMHASKNKKDIKFETPTDTIKPK